MSALPEFVELLKKWKVESRFDLGTRILYSTDASIYQIEPVGVAFPRHRDELSLIVEVARKYQVPLLARGAGSSLAGQAIGNALIIDCSRYLNQILEINAEERYASVEPGVILSSLNKAVGRFGLQFGPDPASAERATMGGSIANNATGAHSILYGMAGDHLVSTDVVLSDSSQATFSEISYEHTRTISQADSVEAALYRAALNIRAHYSTTIEARWPRTWRNAAGYTLNYLIPWSPAAPPGWDEQFAYTATEPLHYPPVSPGSINLSVLLAGSEGTLAIIRSAKVRLVSLPTHTVLAVLPFEDIGQACDAAPGILELAPSAIELIPRMLVTLARSVPAFASQLSILEDICLGAEDSKDLLVVEFSGRDSSSVAQKILRLKERFGHSSRMIVAELAEDQHQVWAVRKVGLGLLASRPGTLKSTAFIEDLSVPVERLGAFVRELQRLFFEYGTTADFYAHASAGCLHIRPMVDLKSVSGVQVFREIAREAVHLTLKHGGSISGEHGVGLSRSEWLEEMYGKDIFGAFKELKKAADPMGLLNPGKLIESPRMDQNLRFGETTQTRSWKTGLDFTQIGGLDGAIEMCNGAGVCRKLDGVMCPSYQATREEMHSTRGRANLLRALISRPYSEIDNTFLTQSVLEALDLCLACKGCKSECPSAVDMAKLKYEFLDHYYQSHQRRVRDYLFAYIGLFAQFGHVFSHPINFILKAGWGRQIAQSWFGLTSRRQLPVLRSIGLKRRMMQLMDWNHDNSQEVGQACLLLSDPFTEYFHPDAGLAAVHVLNALGFRVQHIPVLGAGRTLLSKGFVKQARHHATSLIDAIERLDPDNQLPVIGIEPSEIYSIRDEYNDLVPGNPRLKAIAERAWMVDEFLVRPDHSGQPLIDKLHIKHPPVIERVFLHGHCYQKAQLPHSDGFPTGVEATQRMLEIVGYEVRLLEAGCCGMAGAFGYEDEHYKLSMQIGEMALFPAIRSAMDTGAGIIAAAGISCQSQIEDGTQFPALHPIRLIDRLLDKGS